MTTLHDPPASRSTSASPTDRPRKGYRRLVAGNGLGAGALIVCAALVLIAGCGRPFEEAARPTIDVLAPNLNEIRVDRQLSLSVRVTSSVTVEQVLAGGDTLRYDEARNAWDGVLTLSNGLNRIVLAITDADMQMTFDTLYAMRDVLTASRAGPHLPSSRGGHTATLGEDGFVYVLGGAPHALAPAIASGLVLRNAASSFEPLDASLISPRAGHTATRLPDGRILILGGSTQERVEMTEHLVETAEVFDPVTQTIAPVAIDGEPVRRAYHSATLHEEGAAIYIDLYGGIGDISYRPPILGVRSDIRRFRLDDDVLVALDPAPGPRLREQVAGHSQVDLYPNASINRRDLITGTYYAEIVEQPVSFELEYAPNVGLLQHAVAFPNVESERHAAALLAPGFVGIFGGRQGTYDSAIRRTEVYSAASKHYYRYPDMSTPMARYGHTATKTPQGRILLLGGFLPSGEGVVTTEWYQIPRFEHGFTGITTP